jgi:hypothetical protein
MRERMRAEKKEDRVIEGAKNLKKFTKAELTEKLRQKGILTSGTFKKIKEICIQNNIPTEEEVQKIVQEWGGRQKGLLQCLWEHGWIDPMKLQDYTIEGRIDALGIKQISFSLKHLMANCTDFIEEELLLQSNGWKMGAVINQMPKCHCELAGEGVEYSWACSKNEFHKKPNRQKKSKELFKAMVRECIS